MGWRIILFLLIAASLSGCAEDSGSGRQASGKIQLKLDEVLEQTLEGNEVGEYLCPSDDADFHTVTISGVSSGNADHLDFDMADMMEMCQAGVSQDQKHCQGTMMMGDMEQRFTLTNTTSEPIAFKLQVVAQ